MVLGCKRIGCLGTRTQLVTILLKFGSDRDSVKFVGYDINRYRHHKNLILNIQTRIWMDINLSKRIRTRIQMDIIRTI